MKTKISFNLRLLIVFSLLFATMLVALPVVVAQGSGSSGGQSSGAGQQDRDRIQDPATHDGTEPDQDRDRLQLQATTAEDVPDQDHDRLQTQDRDRIQDPATHDGIEPDQDRDRLQTQDRDRIHVDTPAALRDFVDEQTQTRARVETQATSGQGEMVRSRARAEVATEAFMAAENMLGPSGPRMSEVAEEVNQAMNGLATREEALQDRSRVLTFFFGQDQDQVQLMQQEMEQNQNRLEELKQLLRDCDNCDKETIDLLVEQHQMLEQEQNRVQAVVQEAADKRGVFGFLFGWMMD